MGQNDEELLNECLTAIVVLKTMLSKTGLSAGEKRANDIIKKLTERLSMPEDDSEIPPRYNANLKPIKLHGRQG